MATDINTVFRQLSRTEKTKFINSKLEYASSKAIAEYARDYVLDILEHNTYVMTKYLRERGYTVVEPNK